MGPGIMIAFASQLIFSFGLAAFLGLFVFWFRQPAVRRAHSPYGVPFLYSAAWFGLNLITTDFALLLAAACGFPAILLHLFRMPGTRWAALAGAGVAILALAGRTGPLPVSAAAAAFSVLLGVTLFVTARRNEVRHSSGTFLLVCIALVPVALYAGAPWLRLFVRSLPLSLLLLDSYMRRRFLFFDLFVKWGLAFLLALSLLSLWFAAVPEGLDPLTKSLLFAPLLWLIPLLSRHVGQFMDRRYLQRPFTPKEAEQLLTGALRGAGDEEAVCRAAEEELGRIFAARVQLLPGDDAPESEAEFRLPLESEHGYVLSVRRDEGARPFFSQDFELLHTLGRSVAYVIENRRLEVRRQLLAHEAMRSELKALRAQINPHFLFNALNTVAGLIPNRPVQAEAVIEKLAEVFRYTLRRSESEWSTLGEELESARAYLEVEQARYAGRLQPDINVPPGLLAQRIPSMTLLTMVENAIKHGVARSAGECPLRISAAIEAGRLSIVVRNGGPAPDGLETQGHGLHNVRRRLQAHYGGEASFALQRDNERGETVACIEVPTC